MTTLRFTVTDLDTAQALGSGDVPVLATPRLLAWLEAATVSAAQPWLGDGRTSLGVEVSLDHRRATPVGGRVEVEVKAVIEQGRALVFDVVARDDRGPAGAARDIGAGRVVRALVDRQQFLQRLSA